MVISANSDTKERQNQKNNSADDLRVALVASVIYTLQKFKVDTW